MSDVPPTQRREILDGELAEKQKKSIRDLANARHAPEATVDDVLAGIDILADDSDLEFDWDLDGLLNSGGVMELEDPVEQKEDDPDNHAHNYEYEEGWIVLMKPPPDADEPFWLACVEELGTGNRAGEYLVWHLECEADKAPWGAYAKSMRGPEPATDWVFKEAVQHRIDMGATGKIYATSQRAIKHFVLRWARADDSDSDAEDYDLDEPDDID